MEEGRRQIDKVWGVIVSTVQGGRGGELGLQYFDLLAQFGHFPTKGVKRFDFCNGDGLGALLPDLIGDQGGIKLAPSLMSNRLHRQKVREGGKNLL